MKPLDCLEIYDAAEFYEQEFAQRAHEIPFFLKHACLTNGSVLEGIERVVFAGFTEEVVAAYESALAKGAP